ncbi:hypothetical protein MRX96_023218 [Rhipicephalus microplus]
MSVSAASRSIIDIRKARASRRSAKNRDGSPPSLSETRCRFLDVGRQEGEHPGLVGGGSKAAVDARDPSRAPPCLPYRRCRRCCVPSRHSTPTMTIAASRRFPPNAAAGYQLPDRHVHLTLWQQSGVPLRQGDAVSVEGEPTKPAIPPTPAKWPLRPALKSAQAYKKEAADASKRTQQQPQPGKAPKVGVVPKAYAAREDTVVRFLLLKALDLDPVDDRESCSPYVVFKLGNEKYVSKVMEDTNDPVWNEPFDIFVPVGNSLLLQVMIMDKDPTATSDFIGRFNINLADYQYGSMYEVKQDLDDNAGTIKFRMALDRVGAKDFAEVCDIPTRATLALIRERISDTYERWSVGGEVHDIGEVIVLAHRASTIAPPGSESNLNAICVVELSPKMLWNKGDPKTINPTWSTMYRLKVTDIHAVLQVTVLTDVKKQEFLGTVAFPLISVDSGKKQWYALKDQNLDNTTGGFILLEIDLIYNPMKALICCFKDKGPGPPALNETELTRAVGIPFTEVNTVCVVTLDIKALTRNMARPEGSLRILQTDNLIFSSAASTGCPSRAPSSPSCCFEKASRVMMTALGSPSRASWPVSRRSQPTMQNTMGTVASYGERLINTITFADPFVSRIFLAMLVGAGVAAYIVPARYWALMFVLRKYSRGFIIRFGGIKESGYDLLHLFNRTPDNVEKSRYSTPLPDTDTVPKGTFAVKSSLSLKSLRRLFS